MLETDRHGRYIVGARYAFDTLQQAQAFFEQFESNVAKGYGQVLEACIEPSGRPFVHSAKGGGKRLAAGQAVDAFSAANPESRVSYELPRGGTGLVHPPPAPVIILGWDTADGSVTLHVDAEGRILARS